MKLYQFTGRLIGSILLLVLILPGTSPVPAHTAQTGNNRATQDEIHEAREIAMAFTERFLKTRDLSQIVKDMYLDDFIERYFKFQAEHTSEDALTDFDFLGVPAIHFKTPLLSHPKDEHWQRFYIAANNLFYLGVLSAAAKNKASEPDDLKAGDLYPPEVAKLLDTNPTLANFIEKKGRPVDVGTLEELHNVTSTLEQAVVMAREYLNKELPVDSKRIDEKVTAVRNDPDSIKVSADLLEEEHFGFPKGTRMIMADSPAGFRLMLVKADDRLKILWASIGTED